MTALKQVNGCCLCGAVTVKARIASQIGACHCGMCRKWGGGPALSFLQADDDVCFEGETMIERYASSDWAERGFCKRCGSHLFYCFKGGTGYHFPVGIFDDVEDISFTTQIYIDSKPDYYDFANKTNNMTEAEILAMFGFEPE